LRTLFKKRLLEEGVPPSHIIEMPFDVYENEIYRDPKVFYPWILGKLNDKERYYILLDEVQLLDDFVSVLNGLAERKNCDIYVTGSNAKFLSKDIPTEFGGRGDEIHVWPLSFAEFMSFYKGNKYDGLNEYMTYGGIPLVALADATEQKTSLLDSLFAETYIRDIEIRNRLRNVREIGELLDFLASSIGSLTNPRRLVDAFHAKNKSKITATTVEKYLQYLEESFLVERAKRFDIKGKSYIGTPQKYYFSDLGLRNSRIGYRQLDIGHSLENAIYNELRERGYKVDVGTLEISESNKDGKPAKKQLEVDFVCTNGSKRYYVQSAYLLDTPEKLKREMRPFWKIGDSFKKIIVTSNTPKPFYTDEGILVMNVYDFLMDERSLDY